MHIKRLSLLAIVVMLSLLLFGVSAHAQSSNQATAEGRAQVNSNPQQSLDQTFEASESMRQMPSNARLPGFPGGPSYFAEPKTTHEEMSLPDLARMKTEWDLVDILSWRDRQDLDNVKLRTKSVLTEDWGDELKQLKMTFVKPQSYTFLGILEANAVEEGTTMEAVFGVLAEEAIELGGNVIFPINQGASRVLSASAWGASLGYVHTAISQGPQANAGSGAAGIGYSSGETQYHHKPFARVMVARVDQDTYEDLQVFPENGHEKAQKALKQQNEQLRKKLRLMQQKIRQFQQQQSAQ